MGRDGMLPDKFASVNPRTLTPQFNTVIVSIVVALIAGFVPPDYLWDMVSIGTLAAFTVVSIGVIVLRRTDPELPRPFKVPGLPGDADPHRRGLRLHPVRPAPGHLVDLRHLAADRAGVLLLSGVAGTPCSTTRSTPPDPSSARTSEMTIVVGHSPIRNDRSPLELATPLARSIGTDLHVVVRVPSRWPARPCPAPRTRSTPRGRASWGSAGGGRGHGLAVRLLGGGRLRGRRRPRPVGRGVLEDQAEETGAGMVVVGSADHGEPGAGRARLDRRPDAALLGDPGRDRSAGLSLTVRWQGYRATCALPGRPGLPVPRRPAPPSSAGEAAAKLRVATFGVLRVPTMYPPEVLGERLVLDAYLEQTSKAQDEAVALMPDAGDAVETVVATGRNWSEALPAASTGRTATSSSSASSPSGRARPGLHRHQRHPDRAPLAGPCRRRTALSCPRRAPRPAPPSVGW